MRLLYKYMFLIVLFFVISPGIVYGSGSVTKDFDTRLESSMTAERFDELFQGSKLAGKGSVLIEEAKKNGVNAGFIAGIMAQETGWGRGSKLLNNHNNPGGLTCKNGTSGEGWKCIKTNRYWKSFDNIDIAIKEKAAYLKRMYHDDGLYTIIKIQKRYCPDGDGCGDWVSGVTGAMNKLNEAGGSSKLTAADGAGSDIDKGSYGDFPPSIFSDYDVDVNNIGVNYKSNHDNEYIEYSSNKYIKNIINIFNVLSVVLCVLIIGYVSVLWMFILLARTNFIVAIKMVSNLTFGKVDAFEDLGKIIKISIFLVLFVVIAASGLMPMIFAFVYKIIIGLITLVFRL